MNAAFTRLTALLLLAMAAMPWLITGIQQFRQHQIHREMKEKLEEEILQTITVEENAVKWLDEGKEISVNGRMFDIRSMYRHDHHVTFTGLFDDEETSLLKNIQHQEQKEKSQGTKLLAKLFQLSSTLTTAVHEEIVCPVVTTGRYNNFIPSLNSVYSKVITPPPQTGLFI